MIKCQRICYNCTMSTLLKFNKLSNTRDLGGMRAKDGRTILPGKLIRSGQLYDISPSDIHKLSELIDTVVDFRTEEEKRENPDTDIPGCSYYFIPVVESFSAGVSHEEESNESIIAKLVFDPEGSLKYMCDMYRRFVFSDFSLSQYGKFLRILLDDHERAVLWHCSVGKDRAGTAALIIEKILGIAEEDIIADFLKTNEYLINDLRQITAYAKTKTGSDDPRIDNSMKYLFGTDKAYIETFFKAVDERFGSFEAFVREGLGLSDSDREKLREKYLR